MKKSFELKYMFRPPKYIYNYRNMGKVNKQQNLKEYGEENWKILNSNTVSYFIMNIVVLKIYIEDWEM